MSDMTPAEIEADFRRHVRLCRGLGRNKMLAIVWEAFDDPDEELRKCAHCGLQTRSLGYYLSRLCSCCHHANEVRSW